MQARRSSYKIGAQVRHAGADSALNIQACREGRAIVRASTLAVVRRFDRSFL